MFLVRDLVSARTWLAMTQHLAGLLLGFVAIFIVGFGLAFGVGGLFFALVGLPLLGLTLRLAYWFAQEERARFAFLLGAADPGLARSRHAGPYRIPVGHHPALADVERAGDLGRARLRTAAAAGQRGGRGDQHPDLGGRADPADPAGFGPAMPSGGPTFGGAVLHTRAELTLSAVTGLLLVLAAPQLTRGLAVADGVSRRLIGPSRDLTARVGELELSRERVVDAAEAERRRIERDLHDGAQQRLVSLAMDLGRAKARFADDLDGARELVDQAHAQAKEALTELRNLVRGVHPPVLTDRGLDAALSGVAALSPVPVDVHVDVPAAHARGGGDRLLHRRRGADQRGQARPRDPRQRRGRPGPRRRHADRHGQRRRDRRRRHRQPRAGRAGRPGRRRGRPAVGRIPAGGPTIIEAELPCG